MTEKQNGNPGETPGGGQQDDHQQGGEKPQSFEAWLEGQPEEIRGLADGHVSGLKSALAAEREQRKAVAKELRDALAKAEKGSELEKSLTEMAGRAEAAEQRAVFFEAATQVSCSNPRAAYLVAQAEGLFKRDGSPDWGALQQVAPELFRRAGVQANAGAGTDAPPAVKSGMNEFIRRAAGRG